MNYQIKISLESDICIGSGESRGNAIDQDICVDSNGIPYIPARRLKGCFRETADFLKLCGYDCATEENISKLFGDAYGREGALAIDDARTESHEEVETAIRSIRRDNKEYLSRYIHPENIIRSYTSVRGQTKLEDGLKVDGTLRFTRVLTRYNAIFNEKSPVCFISNVTISYEDEALNKLFEACCKGTRHIGSKRNRGLGNVTITLKEIERESFKIENEIALDDDREYCLQYKIMLDSPITIPEFGDNCTLIPARSVIGCLGGYYAKENIIDDKFNDLFLNGTVRWSALTPVIEGKISTPAPYYVMKLKNGDGKFINHLAESDSSWKKLKPKTIEDGYSVENDGRLVIADIQTRAQYHNSISNSELYTQEAIESGYIYGGTITFPGKYYEDIISVLKKAKLRFGRSKNAQYANCHLISVSDPSIVEHKERTVSGKIYIVLESDLKAMKEGVHISDSDEIRAYLANSLKLNLKEINLNYEEDCIRYGIIGGFNNMWHLQKMHTVTIKAGSLFCFYTEETNLRQNYQIGDYIQEGFGKAKVYTEDEIKKIKTIVRGSCDTTKTNASEVAVNTVEKSLVKSAIRETLLRYSREYRVNKEKIKEDIPVSRLRLMAEKSSEFSEFMEKVNTIKESDVSSRKVGRKATALAFIEDFYGSKEKISWGKIFKSEEGLYKAINDSNDLKNVLDEMWKLPLITVLHYMHYSA